MPPKKGGKSTPTLAGKGRASPGRGRGGAGSPRPPTPPKPVDLPPPTEKDIERKKLRDIMDRKVLVWDRMMDTGQEEERRLGLETFKRLSDDELALATKNLSKDKLKQFIDLKIHYFDQLANARNQDKRVEGLRRFAKVGDDELHLAKMMGPQDSLEDMVKTRNELDQKEEQKRLEEKKKKELLDKIKRQQDLPHVTVSMTDPNMTSQMLAKQQLMRLAEIEKAATENVAQVAYGMPHPDVLAQQQHFLAAAAAGPPLLPMSPLPPMTPPMPPMMPGPFFVPAGGMQTPQSAYGAVAMDLDNKMRLLSQLETTRAALQCQPVGSHSSMAEEIKSNLRKLNQLKMRLIDEILGEGGTPPDRLTTFHHVRKGDRSKKDRKIVVEFVGPGGQISQLDLGKEHDKKDGDRKKTIVLEHEFTGAIQSPSNTTTCAVHGCPAYQQCLAYGCAASAPTGSVSQTMCLNQGACPQPQMSCPYALDVKPEVLWERQEIKTYAEKSTMMDPPEALRYMDAAVTADNQRVVKETYNNYACEEPTYSPPPGYQVMQPNYVPVVPVAMLERGLLETRVRPQHEIGISAIPMEDDPEYAVRPMSCPPVLSKTTIVVNTAAKETAPAPPSPQASVGVVSVPVAVSPAPQIMTQQAHQQAVVVHRSSSSSGDLTGRRALHASMERLARSIDDMYTALSAPRRSRTRRRSRSRSRSRSYDDDDYDDDYGDYERPLRRRRRSSRRRRSRSRSRSRGFRDGWRDYDLDDEDDLDDTTYRTRRHRSRSRSRMTEQDELPSLWNWLCRSLCNITEGYDNRRMHGDPRVLQMGTRIRELIQNVLMVSREVIAARRAIQESGLQGDAYLKSMFKAESKLWELIDLEAQLAEELALYRQSDFGTNDQYFQGLANAEDKIRRLIGVETQLAQKIGNWRKTNAKQFPTPSKTTIYTTLSRIPSLSSMFGRSSSYPSTSATTSGSTTTSTTPSPTTATPTPTATPTSAATATGSTTPSTSSTAGSKKSTASTKKKKKKKKKKKSKGSSKKKKKKRRRRKKGSSKKKRRRKRKSKSRSSKSKKRKKKRRRKKKKK